MRAFVILALVAVAYARPDVSLGYSYDHSGSHNIATPGLAAPLASVHVGGQSEHVHTVSAAVPVVQTVQAAAPVVHTTSYVHAPAQTFGGSVAGPSYTASVDAQSYTGSVAAPAFSASVAAPQFETFSHVASAPISFTGFPAHNEHHFDESSHQVVGGNQAPIITKQFFLHSAPEDHTTITKSKHFVIGRPQKNYRVVFIKAPSSSSANVHLSAEYAPQEEKTVIYVLKQKEHELNVDDIATPAPTQPSKPEVFFIKYNTPEEAAHAQQEIQRQYDIVGGQAEVHNEGQAPETSVIGALGQDTQETVITSTGNTAAGYLPPSH